MKRHLSKSSECTSAYFFLVIAMTPPPVASDGLSQRKGRRRGSPDSVRSEESHLHDEAGPSKLDSAAAVGPQGVFSSGVVFYPPSKELWRIGGKWYDLEPFLRLHPGGAEVLRLARDRFEDATYAFESHHHNYKRARAIIAKYEVPAPSEVRPRPAGAVVPGAGGDGGINRLPELLGDDAFYSVVRRRLTEHLRSVGCASGGPGAALAAVRQALRQARARWP